jgi:hypothetical protein
VILFPSVFSMYRMIPIYHVAAAEGCDLLTLPFKGEDQKIAAFGSSCGSSADRVSAINKTAPPIHIGGAVFCGFKRLPYWASAAFSP